VTASTRSPAATRASDLALAVASLLYKTRPHPPRWKPPCDLTATVAVSFCLHALPESVDAACGRDEGTVLLGSRKLQDHSRVIL